MPLLLLTGLPCSGKSSRAKQLKEKFIELHPDREVVIISENEIINNKPADFHDVFQVSNKEKLLRGEIRSETQRNLSKNRIVIVDAGNYLKSIRYELYCVSKTAKQTFCVVQCEVVETDAWQWNLSSAGLDRRQYTKAEFDNLLERYECPDSKNRWDSPLFMVQSDEDIDFDSIAKCLLEGRAAKANQSTVMMNNLPSNVMCDIEKITKEVTQKVLSQEGGQQIFTKGVVPQAKLLKVQTQFLNFIKKNPPTFANSKEAVEEMEKMFCKFLTENLKV